MILLGRRVRRRHLRIGRGGVVHLLPGVLEGSLDPLDGWAKVELPLLDGLPLLVALLDGLSDGPQLPRHLLGVVVGPPDGAGDVRGRHGLVGAVATLQYGQVVKRILEFVDVWRLHDVDAVLSVFELQNQPVSVADGAVVERGDALHRLHQRPLQITGLGSFDGSVYQPLSPRHAVEEILRWPESGEESVHDEAAVARTQIILGKTRQGLGGEHHGYPPALQVLLRQHRTDHRVVDLRTLRTSHDHPGKAVARELPVQVLAARDDLL
mmetsp:Transcript_49829/g.124934  ORF Transcript_49829/g.124934 Transcript_49829/m.124934 type:complete len:267 (-) Transcript_49829:89-889(-)